MTEKMTPGFAQRLETASEDERVPVIVTLRPGTDVSAFEDEGLEIRHRYDSITAVAGSLKAGVATQLAARNEVERIESDEGEVRAL
jgi:hypothetical protein